MSWRDWFGYPGMLDDEVDKAMLDSIKALAKNLTILAEAHAETVKILNARLVALEEKIELLKLKMPAAEQKWWRPPISTERPFGLGGMTREEYAAWKSQNERTD